MALGKPRRGYRDNNGPDIPLQPLQDWLGRQLDAGASVTELAALLDITERTLLRVRRGERETCVTIAGRRNRGLVPTTTWARFRVEDMCDNAGVDFYELYPEFAHEQDVELEPDAWCSTCREVVTPVHGFCLWCDSLVSKPQAEAA